MSSRSFCAALAATALVFSLSGCGRRSELPSLFPVPAATLTNQNGAPMALATLRGNVVVYDFIFTKCAGICPLMTQRMKILTTKFQRNEAVRFVSFSVDPKNDTPAALREYSEKFGPDDRWVFLTAPAETVADVSIKGFKLAATPSGMTTGPLLHSEKFVLADRAGMIRGYYDSNDEAALEKLEHDARDLLRENG